MRLATAHEQLEPGFKRLKIKDCVSRDNNYSIPIHNLCKHIKYGKDRQVRMSSLNPALRDRVDRSCSISVQLAIHISYRDDSYLTKLSFYESSKPKLHNSNENSLN